MERARKHKVATLKPALELGLLAGFISTIDLLFPALGNGISEEPNRKGTKAGLPLTLLITKRPVKARRYNHL